MTTTFIHELEAYELLEQAGLPGPRRGLVRTREDVARLPFAPGDKVVLKGVAQDVWHKSDLGLVRFEAFDADRVWAQAQDMAAAAAPHGAWVGMLVVDLVPFPEGLGPAHGGARGPAQESRGGLDPGAGHRRPAHQRLGRGRSSPASGPWRSSPPSRPWLNSRPTTWAGSGSASCARARRSPRKPRSWPTCGASGSWWTSWTPRAPTCWR